MHDLLNISHNVAHVHVNVKFGKVDSKEDQSFPVSNPTGAGFL